jgi:hypothetical protein
MFFAALVVSERLLPQGRFQQGQIDRARPRRIRPRLRHDEFQRREQRPRIAVAEADEPLPGLRRQSGVPLAQTPLDIRQRPVEHQAQRLLREGCEHDHERAREERTDDLEGWILGRRPHQDDGAPFDMGKKGVLLGLVEPVDFIDEEDRAPAVQRPALFG